MMSLLLSSCSSRDAQLDVEAPNIKIMSPEPNSLYPTGTALPVDIVFDENLGLHTYFIWLVSLEDNRPYLVDKQHLHTLNLEVSLDFSLDGMAPGSYELLVEADDHDNNKTKATVPVRIE